jgi:hypothetical protein
MSLPSDVRDRFHLSFELGPDSKPRIRTSTSVSGLGGLLEGVSYDRIDVSYPNATTEVYDYSLATVAQATITVVYTSTVKEFVLSVVRT